MRAWLIPLKRKIQPKRHFLLPLKRRNLKEPKVVALAQPLKTQRPSHPVQPQLVGLNVAEAVALKLEFENLSDQIPNLA
jgi:hypothetical protein